MEKALPTLLQMPEAKGELNAQGSVEKFLREGSRGMMGETL